MKQKLESCDGSVWKKKRTSQREAGRAGRIILMKGFPLFWLVRPLMPGKAIHQEKKRHRGMVSRWD
jgi:hypothetical protein